MIEPISNLPNYFLTQTDQGTYILIFRNLLNISFLKAENILKRESNTFYGRIWSHIIDVFEDFENFLYPIDILVSYQNFLDHMQVSNSPIYTMFIGYLSIIQI